MTPADLTCDPVILVWALRDVLRTGNPHAAVTMAAAIRGNAPTLPRGIRDALTRELTGRGHPWTVALHALTLENAA